jgi:hypothetical protein
MTNTRPDARRGFHVESFKAATDAAGALTGEFEAIVSVFGNVDKGGDRVMPGAFTDTLAAWKASGDPIPVIWSHMWENPEAHIGSIDPADASETETGLKVAGKLDVDKPFAAQVAHLLAARRVKEFSFGYSVVKGKRTNDGVMELQSLDLFEVGPTLKGMNPATELLAAKALAHDLEDNKATTADDDGATGIKAGARLSKASRSTVERVIDDLRGLLAADDNAGDQTPQSDEAEAEGKASDPDADLMLKLKLVKEM